jgi:regulator of RNase E activity RraA
MAGMPDRVLLDRLVSLPTGNACDALTEMGRFPALIRGLHALGSLGAFAGPAFTLRQVPRPVEASPSSNLTRQLQVIDELAQPGQVIVIDTGGRDEVCTFGSILMLRAKMREIAGVVTDGAARDVEEIPTVGLPVYTRSANPIASKVFFQTVSVDEPVSCGGAQVRPGDIIFGDATGILVIPPDLLAEVVERAEAIRQKETKWEAGVRSGKGLAESQRTA